MNPPPASWSSVYNRAAVQAARAVSPLLSPVLSGLSPVFQGLQTSPARRGGGPRSGGGVAPVHRPRVIPLPVSPGCLLGAASGRPFLPALPPARDAAAHTPIGGETVKPPGALTACLPRKEGPSWDGPAGQKTETPAGRGGRSRVTPLFPPCCSGAY